MQAAIKTTLRRPIFRDASEYVESVRAAVSRNAALTRLDHQCGRAVTVWEPQTRDEFLVLESELPELARRFRPPKEFRNIIGLPATYGERIEPFGELFQERFLSALARDSHVRSAVKNLLAEAE